MYKFVSFHNIEIWATGLVPGSNQMTLLDSADATSQKNQDFEYQIKLYMVIRVLFIYLFILK